MTEEKFSGALETVLLRNQFYESAHRYALLFCLCLFLLLSGVIALNVVEYMNPPRPIYFAATPDTKLVDLVPLNKPNMTDEQVIQWATDAAIASFNYNFVNYRTKLQSVRTYFTPTGHQRFLKALLISRNLEAVKDKKFVVSAIPSGPAELTQQGVIKKSGLYAWYIKIPMTMYLRSANEEVPPQNYLLSMIVVRTDMLQSPKGVGIAQYILEEPKTAKAKGA